MLRRLLVVAITVASAVVPAASAGVAHADQLSAPSSMSALGDSVTRAFDSAGWYTDAPSRSWATGDEAGMDSHYLRIRSKNPAINGRNYNDAKTGAKSDALAGQVQQAVAQKAEYVTILMGANDACTPALAQMTSVANYRANIANALTILKKGTPTARVFIASIPDLQQLWNVGKSILRARTAWSLLHVCQSILNNPTSTASADQQRRDHVRQRVIDYNAELAKACADYGTNCRFDHNAVFNYRFTADQISHWDYFHPNLGGQKVLADVTYRAGYNW